MKITFEDVLKYLSTKKWNLKKDWEKQMKFLTKQLKDPEIKPDDRNSIKRYKKYFKEPLTFDHNLTTYKTGRIFANYVLLPNKPIYDIFLKELIIPEEGYIFVSFDFNASQVRHLAEDRDLEILKKLFEEDKDVYKEFANEIGLERKEAKIIFLTLSYGGNIKTIEKNFPLAGKENTEKAIKIFEKWTNVEGMSYQEKVKMNHAIQKREVEFMKRKMKHIYRKQNEEFRLHAFIHDEIILEIRKDSLYHIEKIKKYLEKNDGIKMKVKTQKSKTFQFK